MACQWGHLEVVKYLVEQCKISFRSAYDVPFASEYGHLEVVKYLVERCRDVSIPKWAFDNALTFASANGHLNIVKYLVEKCGADVMCTYNSPIYKACMRGHFEVVKYLNEHGATNIYCARYERYLDIFTKGIINRKERMVKRIYFWWVQKCYNVNNLCGNRMMKKKYEEFKNIN